jgi:hypothetical protein
LRIKKVDMAETDRQKEIRERLKYWLSRSPEERIAEVERLRREVHGDPQPMQRVGRIVKRSDQDEDS